MPSVEQVKSTYRRMLGDQVYLRRYDTTVSPRTFVDISAQARVTGFQPHELVGNILQGDRKIILFAQDLIDQDFQFPVTTNDKVVVGGKELAIIAPDHDTRKVGSELIALEIQARG